MPSVRFAPTPIVTHVPLVPTDCFSSVFYSKSELREFRDAERHRCGRIMTKGSLQSRVLSSHLRKQQRRQQKQHQSNKLVLVEKSAQVSNVITLTSALQHGTTTTNTDESSKKKRGFLGIRGPKGRAEARRTRLLNLLVEVDIENL